jgi:hypothetical protein
MSFLQWIEFSAFATWVRESQSLLAYTLFLSFHTIGLAFLVGLSTVVALRILGLFQTLPLAPMASFFPFMVLGFWVNAVTGVVLTIAAPTNFLTMTTFYVKLAAIASALVCLRALRRDVFRDLPSVDKRPLPANAKPLAGALLALWATTIVAGRLTAYSRPVIVETVTAVLVVAILVLAAWYFARPRPGRVPSQQRA